MQTPLREVMTWTMLTVRPSLTVTEAMTIMANYAIDHLFVVDATDRFLGIVTDHTLLKAELTGRATETTVDAWMHCRPEILTPDHTVADAVKLCRDGSLSRIPIVRDGRLLGVVCRRDVLKWIVRHRVDAAASAITAPHHTARELVTV
ncbi:MAG TPA: CBS domain-containing protein [Planctomycetaceae bacterium]|nr:CBS domain-containing protein [Planctomycetaceae bacterium]